MKKVAIILSFVGFSLLQVVAANTTDLPSKLYVSGALGYANSGWDYAGYNSTGLGFDTMLGYHYTSLWSFEAGYTHLPKSTLAGSSISSNVFSMFAKLKLPITVKNLNFYSKAGFGYFFTSGDSSSTHLALGLAYGVDYPIKPNLDIEGQFTHYIGRYKTNPVPDANYLSVGVSYRIPAKILQ